MAKLILSLEGSVLREIPLDKERISIGRKPHNDIQIENLAVSGEHACIVTILNDSFLEDLGSTNGTLVNGNPIKKHILQHNDVIEIGKYKLKYVSEAPGAGKTTVEDFEKTMVLQRTPAGPKPASAAAPRAAGDAATRGGAAAAPSAMPAAASPSPAAQTAAAPAAAAQPAAKAQPLAVIQLLSGPNVGRELELTKNITTLGKPGVQVAVIARRPQGYFITHVEGASFPIVNGKTLDAQAHRLNDHDVIELAGVKMEFFYRQ
jgi:pSer/pThr/pTyr-binding forkhead associated (FHA) protein